MTSLTSAYGSYGNRARTKRTEHCCTTRKTERWSHYRVTAFPSGWKRLSDVMIKHLQSCRKAIYNVINIGDDFIFNYTFKDLHVIWEFISSWCRTAGDIKTLRAERSLIKWLMAKWQLRHQLATCGLLTGMFMYLLL